MYSTPNDLGTNWLKNSLELLTRKVDLKPLSDLVRFQEFKMS
jgi:hypothetical protein